MPVLRNIGLCAVCPPTGGQSEIGAIPNAAIAFRDGVIRWVGPASALPASEDDGESWNAHGATAIPGLVDAHTHLAFGGWRSDEFVARLSGTTYQEIARRGGGIASTVASTRASSEEALLKRAAGFAREMAALGVTTAEAKSGYGLDRDTELRLLRVYRSLDAAGPLRIVPTYLGAHVVPPEHAERRGEYLSLVVSDMIPRVAREKLARFCDIFLGEGAFTIDEARPIVMAARGVGLGIKIHADQLSDESGALFAARMGAVSADHLEHVSPEGIAALKSAGTVAVSLPIAALTLGAPPAPVRALIAAGVPLAVATDFNPGTAPSYHLPWALTLACTMGKMTPAEALKGATSFAARAVGRPDLGSLVPGGAADVALLDAPSVDHWLYHFRANACLATIKGGAPTFLSSGFSLL